MLINWCRLVVLIDFRYQHPKTCPLKKLAKDLVRRSISVCGAGGDSGVAGSAAFAGGTIGAATEGRGADIDDLEAAAAT